MTTPRRAGPLRRAWHRLEYAADRLVLGWLIRQVTSGDFARACQRTVPLARVGRRLLWWEWAWAQRNLRLVFGPGLAPESRRRLAALALQQQLMGFLEALRAPEVRVDIEGEDRLAAARAQGRGVLACSVHLGSWEPAIRRAAQAGFPAAAVYRRRANPWRDRRFQAVRAGAGAEWIPQHDARAARRALGEGKVLCVMIDRDARRAGVPAEFLGIPAMCPAGPAKLALRAGSPVLPCVVVRTGVGRATAHVGPPIDAGGLARDRDAVVELTRRINAAFEPWVLAYAEQYNWFYPRWRTRPGGRRWGLAVPMETMWAERTAPFSPLPPRLQALIQATAR